MTEKGIGTDAFAQFASKRKAEQREIERVGVYGEPEKAAQTEDIRTEPAANNMNNKKTRKKETMDHMTLSLPHSVVKGLKIMAVERDAKSVSAMITDWYYEHC